MMVKLFTVGALMTNCYIVSCEHTREAIIIDPGFDNNRDAEKIFKYVNDESLTLKFVLNTHGHPDHTCGNGIVKEKFNVPILIHEFDAPMLGERGKIFADFLGFRSFSPKPDIMLRDGTLVKFGKITLKVMHTPGHSHGGIALIGDKEIFTGDTLFWGSIGRTDFPESSEQDMMASLKKLAALPDHFVVYPGHGPTTTIGEEKRNNPFLKGL
ncbi:MAG: MBL fold metallo-hydrolase [Candidatus Bathyarchaeota archaeon]|nr:MBL fold metallo-hydrolase [Candidatus Bathyarchaeota archaeon]